MAENSWEQLIAAWEPRMRMAFLEAVYQIRDSVTIKELARLIEAGRIDDAVRAVGLDPGKFRGMNATLAAAYEAGGVAVMASIPPAVVRAGYRLNIDFNVRNLRAEEWLRSYSAQMIREITESQRVMIRDVLVKGMEEGRGPREVAGDLLGSINRVTGKREHGLIGLTQTQVEWARNYARELATGDPAALTRKMRDAKFDRIIRRAIAEKRGLTKAEAMPIFRAYLHRALRVRAETIARTEMLASLHAAQSESYQQAIDAGQLTEAQVTKTWVSMRDDRVRFTHDEHGGLDGTTVPFSGVFISPRGAVLRYPGDKSAPLAETINCRCHLRFNVDYLAGIR